MWPEPLKLCTIAAAALAGAWLVWLGLVAAPESLPIAPPPMNTAFAVMASTSRSTTPPESGRKLSAFAPLAATPRARVLNSCLPASRPAWLATFRHPRCPVLPTPGASHMGVGSVGSENR